MALHDILWRPDPDRVAASGLERFRAWVAEHRGVETAGYADLQAWSCADLEGFWGAVAEFHGVRFHTRATAVLADASMPGARWFPGATLNYAEHVFAGRDPDAIAVHHASELRPLATWTWRRLTEETVQVRSLLAAAGVGPGDRVAAYLPNLPETVAAFLATASLGAIWSSAAPEFGARTVVDRFAQIEPTVLLAVDGYRYGGRDHDRSAVVDEIAALIPSDPTVIRLGYLSGTGWPTDGPGAPGGVPEPPGGNPELRFEPVGFDHPLWILYSSGTTGLPKAIVHGHGGILLEQLKVGSLQLDARSGDNVFWFTTTGWMMWNFLVGVLLSGAAIALYDGNPGHPTLDTLWDLAAAVPITTFGTSAAFLTSCAKAGVEPARGRDLSRLRAVGSTGSPLPAAGFRWVYEHVGADTWLFSTSGGTDVCTAFVGGVPTLPVREGELQARALGAAVEAFDPDGRRLIGEVGELVLTRPMPSMPVGFWNDPDGSRLRAAYYDVYPGIWRHGDWIELTLDGGAIIHGRSDSTINRGGVRIGTAELYAAVLALAEITDALVIDLPDPDGGDSRIELFVVCADGVALDADLRGRLRRRIREDCSPRHLPDDIISVPALPRTLSGKLLEVPIKRILAGAPVETAVSRGSLADPAALEAFLDAARAALAARAGDVV